MTTLAGSNHHNNYITNLPFVQSPTYGNNSNLVDNTFCGNDQINMNNNGNNSYLDANSSQTIIKSEFYSKQEGEEEFILNSVPIKTEFCDDDRNNHNNGNSSGNNGYGYGLVDIDHNSSIESSPHLLTTNDEYYGLLTNSNNNNHNHNSNCNNSPLSSPTSSSPSIITSTNNAVSLSSSRASTNPTTPTNHASPNLNVTAAAAASYNDQMRIIMYKPAPQNDSIALVHQNIQHNYNIRE
ncbi:6743_t:CDS:2 [Entrophospora sp. SA101]|nr:6743_t:CDS:2 [Entrophospora sp. SA101]